MKTIIAILLLISTPALACNVDHSKLKGTDQVTHLVSDVRDGVVYHYNRIVNPAPVYRQVVTVPRKPAIRR